MQTQMGMKIAAVKFSVKRGYLIFNFTSDIKFVGLWSALEAAAFSAKRLTRLCRA